MKQPSLIMKIIMAVLLVGIVVYFGIYLVRSYQGGVTTVLAYEDTVDVGLEATGLLVREETVLTSSSASSSLVDLTPAEGEKVSAGGVVATLYSSSSGLDTKQQIRTLESELEQLQYVLNSSGAASDAAKLDADILSAIAGLHASIAQGDLSNLEDDALELRTLVFKRDYTYGDTDAAASINALIQEKTVQLGQLRSALGSVSTTLYAPASGVFSGVVDGYESLLSPDLLETVTPSQLLELQRQHPQEDANAVGKLITSATWYFATVLSESDAADLREGRTYTLSFSHDWSGQADMTLDRISDPEDGKVAVVFSCREHLSETTLLRAQTVDVVTESLTGLRVPRQALRVLTETETDEEGQEVEVSVTGVFVAVGSESEFKPVNVLWQDDTTYLVEPADPNDSHRLNAGDEVLISTTGLYDGKVIR